MWGTNFFRKPPVFYASNNQQIKHVNLGREETHIVKEQFIFNQLHIGPHHGEKKKFF